MSDWSTFSLLLPLSPILTMILFSFLYFVSICEAFKVAFQELSLEVEIWFLISANLSNSFKAVSKSLDRGISNKALLLIPNPITAPIRYKVFPLRGS